MGYTPRHREPWGPEVTVFSRAFRDLINDIAETVHRFAAMEPAIRDKLILPEVQRRSESFWAQLGVATRDGPEERWRYKWQEVYTSKGEGRDGWQLGDRRDAELGMAFNVSEMTMDDPNIHGSGYKVPFATGFELAPAPAGRIVRMHASPIDSETTPMEYWFDFQNVPQGDCPVGSATGTSGQRAVARTG